MLRGMLACGTERKYISVFIAPMIENSLSLPFGLHFHQFKPQTPLAIYQSHFGKRNIFES